MEANIHHSASVGVQIKGSCKNLQISQFAVIGYDYSEQRAKFYNSKASPPPSVVFFGDDIFVGPNTIISSGSTIGNSTTIEHNCYIGEDSKIGDNCFIRYKAEIYRSVSIGNNCVVSGFLCNDTILENNITFHGRTIHRFLDRVPGSPEPSPQICEGAFVGFNATIVGPIVVGANAIIKTGATVLASVPEGRVVNTGEIYREHE